MESRLNDIHDVRNNILTECEKMLRYVNVIKNKSDGVINYLKQLSTSSFLKQYYPIYKYLHELNEKLVDHNCQFELFFLELKDFPPANFCLNIDTEISNKQIISPHNSMLSSNMPCGTPTNDINSLELSNSNILESTIEIEANSAKGAVISDINLLQTTQEYKKSKTTKEPYCKNSSNPGGSVVIESVIESKEFQSISNRHESYTETETFPCDSNSASVLDEDKYMNSIETKSVSNKETDDLNVLNIQNIVQTLHKRVREQEQKRNVKIPDLRPVVVTTDCYESTSSSENSNFNLTSPERIKNKKISHKKPNEIVKKEKIKDIIKHIQIRPNPIPKEGDLCYVSHVESPSQFYIQIISDDTSLIDCLSNQIAEVLPSLKSFHTKLEAQKTIRDYCVCYIEKNKTWYRAKINNWLMENEELISVQLVDYGYICFVPLRNIREAMSYFFDLHIMATKCELAWVKPPNNVKEWPEKSIEYIRKILCSNEDSLYFISYIQQNSDILAVDLQNSNILSLAGDLIAHDVATQVDDSEDENYHVWCNDFMKDQIIHSQGFSKEELNMAEGDKIEKELDFDDDDDEEHNDPTMAVAHYKPRDEIEICRIFLSRGYCFKGDNCRFSHAPLNPDGWTTDRDAVYFESFNQLSLPYAGDDVTVKVISIVDLRTFYVVIKNALPVMSSVPQPINKIKDLVKLMNDPMEVKKYKPLKVKPACGELILVKHNQKDWQRGKVLECYEYCNRVELDVFLVDFGIVLERVNTKEVRTIEEKHLHLPFQVIMCCLANVLIKENLTEEEHDMGSDYLEMNVLNKKLNARVVYASTYISVHLYNEQGNDIGEELLKAEIVQKCPHLITRNENYPLLID